MEHHIIYKKDGIYAAFPQLDHLEDGRVAASFSISFKRDHHVIGDWAVLASDDGGRTWAPSDDPSIPHNWPAPTTRECSDRFNAVLKDGTYLCAGSTGSEVWDEDRRGEAEAAGMQVSPHPWLEGKITVRELKLFVQYSEDEGQTWVRREWTLPGFQQAMAFSRGTMLEDGTVLVPVYGMDTDGNGRSMVWRSGPDGKRGWRLLSLGTHSKDLSINESSFVEVETGRVLALSRNATGYFTQMWSDDGGRKLVGAALDRHLGAALPSPPVEAAGRAYPVHVRLPSRADGHPRCPEQRRRGDVGHGEYRHPPRGRRHAHAVHGDYGPARPRVAPAVRGGVSEASGGSRDSRTLPIGERPARPGLCDIDATR